MRFKRTNGFLAGLALAMPCLAAASPTCPDQAIRLAFYEYGFYYSNGKGVDRDVVDELVKRTGCQFTIDVRPRARIWKDLKDGRLDMATSGVDTLERKTFFWFLPYMQQRPYALLSSVVPPHVQLMEDFFADPAPLRWGAVRAFSYGTYYDLWVAKLRDAGRLDEVTNNEQLFLMIQRKHIAGMLATPMVYREAQARLGVLNAVRVIDWKPDVEPMKAAMVLSKKTFSKTDAQAWQAVIDQMNEDGTLHRIIRKYLNSEEAKAASCCRR